MKKIIGIVMGIILLLVVLTIGYFLYIELVVNKPYKELLSKYLDDSNYTCSEKICIKNETINDSDVEIKTIGTYNYKEKTYTVNINYLNIQYVGIYSINDKTMKVTNKMGDFSFTGTYIPNTEELNVTQDSTNANIIDTSHESYKTILDNIKALSKAAKTIVNNEI